MAAEQIMERMTFILNGDDLHRVHVQRDNEGNIILVIDVHEMKVAEAKKILNHIIIMYRFPFKLRVVHGYNHGTAIKDMIAEQLDNKRIISKEVEVYNPGITTIQLAY